MSKRLDREIEVGRQNLRSDLSFSRGQNRQKGLSGAFRGLRLSQKFPRLCLREKAGDCSRHQEAAHGFRRGANSKSAQQEREAQNCGKSLGKKAYYHFTENNY